MTTPRETELDGQPSVQADTASSAPGPADQANAQSADPAPAEAPEAVPRAGGASPRSASTPPTDPGPGWAQGGDRPATPDRDESTTVLPGGRRPAAQRPVPPRATPRAGTSAGARPAVGRSRRARLSLRRIDPWSVFLFSLVASVFLGIALVVAVAVLYAVLGSLGVTASINQLFAEVTGGSPTTGALLTSGRIIGGAAVLAAVNVVFLTLLSTLGALLYNLCASFTGGLELTLGERD